MRRVITGVVLAAGVMAGCARETPRPRATPPFGEDEFAMRAAALAKLCELVAVYAGNDNARAAALAAQGRDDALAAVRRAPDAYRGLIFARTAQRLDDAVATLTGAGDYAPPLSDAEYERLRTDLVAAADELAPLGERYYLKLARRYEGPPPRPAFMGPRAAPTAASAVAPPRAAIPGSEASPEAPAGTASVAPAPPPAPTAATP